MIIIFKFCIIFQISQKNNYLFFKNILELNTGNSKTDIKYFEKISNSKIFLKHAIFKTI